MSRIVDVVVVGGGHAGCEAALACARLGKETLLVTGSIERIAAMSCNPAIGGVGKGHLVKELDVLGGEMGRVADETGIHFRTLNESRGPAVRATRCQSDMDKYQRAMSRVIAQTAHLRLRQDDVTGLHVEEGRAAGVVTRHGEIIRARRVILTTGTFLGGLLHRGQDRTPGGRAGEAQATGLSSSLSSAGLVLGRLKTGTCPRIDARTIDTSGLEEQTPDVPAPRFSLESPALPPLPQVSCWLTRTTKQTHQVIHDAVDAGRSPLFNGSIEGRGPRYCPSLEDKVIRFSEKESHLIFLEPHGLDTFEVYPNGLSTSLPPDVQLQFLRTIPGLKDVEVTRWGYAVEYDFVEPTQLSSSLETKKIPGLYCAGQLNGTTGYEEAAIQGLLAGINASRSLDETTPVVLRRDQAYAGVLVDDLVTKGTDEPYRMFTSRAEHRLLLREDNVAARLLEVSEEIGLLNAVRRARLHAHEDAVASLLRDLAVLRVLPTAENNARLQAADTAPITETTTAAKLMRRPQLQTRLVRSMAGLDDDVDARVAFRVETELRYGGYLERAAAEIARERALDDEALPSALFDRLAARERLPGISHEVKEKLLRLRPSTLGQASRIQGVTPAAIGLLAVELKRIAS
ncbi:MAG: tRNA uridine-5-carboxymethylaminomethyl(34) synthesis enzyme MnmG [Deltaproteobacteria bacterium]|nr:tRNA uridine-5-carboxymethylaminomethyl(34) synthesis enzyme MnmG [Deltaproteobacteria bacterium]